MAIEGNATSSIESAPDGVLEEGIARRVVYINDPKATNKRYEYAGNNVRTSKYTIVSFLPRNLFEQFHRVAYIYFLVIVILNQIPQLAVFGRTASLFPLVFVLVVTAIKDAYEDWGRHRSDTRENNRLSTVVQDGKFSTKKWKAILVGEVIKICENETVPCDIVLLATSDPTGVAYIQTVNLDGESNLKTRYARQETLAKKPELGSITGCLYCEEPNRNIYEFTAYMEFDGVQLPLGPSNIILRGCEVKNTPWVVGVVVYAGQETKAMLNSAGAQSKRSRLEKQMNREVAWLAVFLLAIAFVGGLGMGLWVESHEAELDILPYYVERGRNGENYRYYGKVGEGIFGFLSCIITFQIMVPISLYISMELVRLGQTYFMSRDLELYHAETDTRFQARALNINEDLGQVKYVFSDKTGTLTENVMEFQTATIDGIDYANVKVYTGSEDVDESSAAAVDLPTQGYIDKRKWRPGAGAKLDPRLVYVLQGPLGTAEWKAAHDFMLTLTTCNTVVPSSAGPASEGVESAGAIKYQAESPDEQALVSAAASYGYVLMERNSEYILVSVLGVTQRFDVLGVHEFDSIRKRMSVVLKCPDGTVQVLVKGADTEVLDKVAAQPVTNKGSKHATDVMLATLSHLDRYAREGLRTLVVASKQLNAADLTAWDAAHRKASISLRNRAGMMRSAADLVETNLTLLGATGIEDKLQDGVPETIAALREAGMKVWVLTGDKQETAISIGFSCLLLTRDMEIIIINETSQDGCREAIGLARRKYGIVQKGMERSSRSQQKARRRKDNFTGSNGDERGSGLASEVSDPLTSGVVEEGSAGNTVQPRNREPRRKAGLPLALVIDGNSLVHALSQDLEEELLELAMACKVVVCCRVAPLQKAGLVSLVKRKTKEITLSVGDGANDVSMIQMADVGVGISGQEGRQAVMASDFAVGQFRFLRRLLLVHGHWNYERLAYMVLYNLYRNAVFVMMLFWFILYTAYSSVPALSEWNLVFYSLIYTSVPTIVAGILDKDVEAKTLLNYPPLYGGGQRGESYNKVLFWSTMLDTLWQSLVLFYAVYLTYRRSDVDVASLGDLWTVAVVVLVNVQLALHVRTWTWIHHVAFWGSVVATFISILVMDALTLPDLLRYHWVLYRLAATAAFWLDLMLVLILALLPHFFVQAMKVRFWPSDVDIVRAVERQGRHVDMSERSGVELSEVPGA